MHKTIIETISDKSIDLINLANYRGHVAPTDIDSHTIAEDLTALHTLRADAQNRDLHTVMEITDCINILKVVISEC